MKWYDKLVPRWPTIEEWLCIAFFAITWKILDILERFPAFLGIPAFMQFAGTLVGGGLLLIASHYFQREKGNEKKDDTMQILADKVPPQTGEAQDAIERGSQVAADGSSAADQGADGSGAGAAGNEPDAAGSGTGKPRPPQS